MKKIFATLITLCFIIQLCPVFASTDEILNDIELSNETTIEDQLTSKAELDAELTDDGISFVWSNAPENLSDISLEYSFGGLKYESWSIKSWGEWSESPIPELTKDGELHLFYSNLDETSEDSTMPLTAYREGVINNIYFRLNCIDSNWDSFTTPSVRISRDDYSEIDPNNPIDFSAEIAWGGGLSYSVTGLMEHIPPNIAQVRSMYSLDGINYVYAQDPYVNGAEIPLTWSFGTIGNSEQIENIKRQEMFSYRQEPMVSFLNHDIDDFWVKIEIIEESSEPINGESIYTTYCSKPVHLSRNLEPMPMPEYLYPQAMFGFDFSVADLGTNDVLCDENNDLSTPQVYTRGEYRMTISQNATVSDVLKLLPKEVPVRVRLLSDNKQTRYAFGDISCPISWNEEKLKSELLKVDLTLGDVVVLSNVSESPVVPAGTNIKTAVGTYILQEDLFFKTKYDLGDIALVIKPVEIGDIPQITLAQQSMNPEDAFNQNQPLSIAFYNKPSGATSIEAYARLGNTKYHLGDLLDKRDINHNQSSAMYGYVELLEPTDEPYRSFLDGEIDNFIIGITIKGSVYDGQTLEMPWPGNYLTSWDEEYLQPTYDPWDNDGGELNIGTNFDEVSEDNNSGKRPWLGEVDDEQPSDDWYSEAMQIFIKPKPTPKPTPSLPQVEDDVDEDELKSWKNPYTDVLTTQYFYEGVAFANHNGLMIGTTKTTFSPYEKTTRGMLVTVLARIANVDTNGGESWYSKGVSWAIKQGVSDGNNPEGNLTREQMITMLWRASKSPYSSKSLALFNDSDEISDFAKTAMSWGYKEGIIKGTSTKYLSPKDTVSRGEFATILMRYINI